MSFLPSSRRPATWLEPTGWRDIDELLNRFSRGYQLTGGQLHPVLALDVQDEDRQYIVKVNAPGVTRKDFELSFENGMLTIQLNESSESEDKGASYLVRERVTSSAARSVSLPLSDPNGSITANLKDGVLTIGVPKRPEKQTRKIEIS